MKSLRVVWLLPGGVLAAFAVLLMAVGLLVMFFARGDSNDHAEAAGPTPGMSLSAPGTVLIGEAFIVTVNADPAPDVEFAGFRSQLLFPGGELKYTRRASCADEVQVERADGGAIALCDSFTTTLRGPGAAHVVLSEFAQPAATLDVAPGSRTPLLELDFVCSTPGSYTLILAALPQSQDGASYDSVDGGEINVKTVEHEMADLTRVADALRIECADELGDVSCDSAVTIADAQLIAQLIVGRIPSLPPP